MKKIAVFGANGNIGSHAVQAFRKAGWQVRAITRNGQYPKAHGIETARADAMDQGQVISATAGCNYIINCVNPPYPKWQEMCLPIATNIISAAQHHGAVHLFPANVYNYGTQIPAIITDETAMNPDTKKGQIRWDMELLFKKYAEEKSVQTLILRAGDFFGGPQSQSSWFDTVITKYLAKGKMIYPGPIDATHSWAYLPDLAQAFVDLAEVSEELPVFEIFLFKGHAIKGAQLRTAIEQTMEKPLKLSGLPWPLLKFAGLFSAMMREVCEMSYLWDRPHQMDGRKLNKLIKNLQHTPLSEAVYHSLKSSQIADPDKITFSARSEA